jgi:hypothetical protein
MVINMEEKEREEERRGNRTEDVEMHNDRTGYYTVASVQRAR